MAMTIVRDSGVSAKAAALFTLKKRTYISPDGSKVVDEKAEHKLVLGNEGQKIPLHQARALGLSKKAQAPDPKKEAAAKAKKAAADKAKKLAADKAKKLAADKAKKLAADKAKNPAGNKAS